MQKYLKIGDVTVNAEWVAEHSVEEVQESLSHLPVEADAVAIKEVCDKWKESFEKVKESTEKAFSELGKEKGKEKRGKKG